MFIRWLRNEKEKGLRREYFYTQKKDKHALVFFSNRIEWRYTVYSIYIYCYYYLQPTVVQVSNEKAMAPKNDISWRASTPRPQSKDRKATLSRYQYMHPNMNTISTHNNNKNPTDTQAGKRNRVWNQSRNINCHKGFDRCLFFTETWLLDWLKGRFRWTIRGKSTRDKRRPPSGCPSSPFWLRFIMIVLCAAFLYPSIPLCGSQ